MLRPSGWYRPSDLTLGIFKLLLNLSSGGGGEFCSYSSLCLLDPGLSAMEAKKIDSLGLGELYPFPAVKNGKVQCP